MRDMRNWIWERIHPMTGSSVSFENDRDNNLRIEVCGDAMNRQSCQHATLYDDHDIQEIWAELIQWQAWRVSPKT